ncbi:MAG: Na+/H+ antiporter subunit D [Phycisphaeraceae bacterium]|nr:Na+/H+ antiporter subunit D [Phycisphaeraceae bacterium]
MNPHLIILFVLVPMTAGVVTLLLHRHKPAQRVIGLFFLLFNVITSLSALYHVYAGADRAGRILVSQMGNWPAPFGITIAVDPLAAIMLAVCSIVCLAVFIYCVSQLKDNIAGGYFHPLYHLLIFGVQWSFITGDLFNLFVAFEIMLMASYAMFCLGTTRDQMRQAYKYVLLNLVGSTLFVTCAGMLYGQLGTLNMADMARIALQGQLPTAAVPVVAMLLVVFGLKTAIFPIWFWLPDSYYTMPAAIGGLFAGLLTKVGAYVMIRVFVMMFGTAEAVTQVVAPVILVSAAVTMFFGVLGAVSMHTVRRILSIHIISQVGYMIFGVGLAIGAGLSEEVRMMAAAGAIFFIIHNMAVKCCLFLCGGLMVEHAGSDDLEKIGGLLPRAPWLAALFLVAALSLAGLPPLSGFFGKWVLIKEGWTAGHYVITGFAIATSLLTLLSMLKIWSYGFWNPPRGHHVDRPHDTPRTSGGIVAIAMLVFVALSMGFGAQAWFDVCRGAARSLIDPKPYITAVLGPRVLDDYGLHQRIAARDLHEAHREVHHAAHHEEVTR